MELQNRVAIVTGGAVRIGQALSLAMSQAGMRVCLHYGSSAVEAQDVAGQIRADGGDVVTVQADLLDPIPAAKQIVHTALDSFGRVDVLINNASIFEPGTLDSLTADDWTRHQAINLAAPAFLCREFAAAIAQSPNSEGAIINIADWRALRPQPGHLAYTISKAGLVALTQILAQELAPSIRVNAIAPGAILPPPGADEPLMDRIRSLVPLERIGNTNEITTAALYLLQSEFVNGEILHVTGGQQLVAPEPFQH